MFIKLCICFGICLSSKRFHLRLFFLFSNLGLIIAQQTSIHINYFMIVYDTPHANLSQKRILWERGLVKQTSQPWGVSYLINSFLTDIKQLAKTSKGGTLRPPSDVCVRSFLCLFSHFNKTLLHKSTWVIKHGPWSLVPKLNLLQGSRIQYHSP